MMKKFNIRKPLQSDSGNEEKVDKKVIFFPIQLTKL